MIGPQHSGDKRVVGSILQLILKVNAKGDPTQASNLVKCTLQTPNRNAHTHTHAYKHANKTRSPQELAHTHTHARIRLNKRYTPTSSPITNAHSRTHTHTTTITTMMSEYSSHSHSSVVALFSIPLCLVCHDVFFGPCCVQWRAPLGCVALYFSV